MHTYRTIYNFMLNQKAINNLRRFLTLPTTVLWAQIKLAKSVLYLTQQILSMGSIIISLRTLTISCDYLRR